MKWLAYVLAVALIVPGALFALQGLRVLPSPLMYGRTEWIVIGVAMVLVGGIIVVWTTLRARKTPAHPPAA